MLGTGLFTGAGMEEVGCLDTGALQARAAGSTPPLQIADLQTVRKGQDSLLGAQ